MKKTGVIMVIIIVAIHAEARGEPEERQGFFWGGGLGAGYLDQSYSNTNGVDEAGTRFYMDFFGGYAINPHVSVGMEIGGWLITPDSDTYQWNPYWPPDNEPAEEPQGEGMSRVLVFTRIYPYRDRGAFVKLAGGYMDHWYKSSAGRYNQEGWTSTAGVGWDLHLSGNWTLTPTLSYSYGEAGYETHQAVTLSFGFMWHQWRGPDRFGTKSATAYGDAAERHITQTDSRNESAYHYY